MIHLSLPPENPTMKTERMSEQTFKIGDRVRVKPGWCRCHGGQEAEVKEVSKTAVRLKFPNAERPVMVGIEGVERVSPDEQAAVCAKIAQTESADEQALRDAVVDTQMALHDFDCAVEAGTKIDEFGMIRRNILEPAAYAAIEALRTHRTALEPAPELLPCPFCGESPETGPDNPTLEGDAWGEVRCVNELCPAQPCVADGEDVNDDRGTAAYIASAISRWNTRHSVAKPETTALVEPEVAADDSDVAQRDLYVERFTELFERKNTTAFVDAMDFAKWYHAYKTTGQGRTFKPQVQKVEASDEAIMALRESLPTLSKAGPDGKSMHPDYCVIWPYSRAGIIQLVNAALTKFTPPKAGTLTDAEIAGEWKGNYGIPFSVVLEFARAIEAKIRSAA